MRHYLTSTSMSCLDTIRTSRSFYELVSRNHKRQYPQSTSSYSHYNYLKPNEETYRQYVQPRKLLARRCFFGSGGIIVVPTTLKGFCFTNRDLSTQTKGSQQSVFNDKES